MCDTTRGFNLFYFVLFILFIFSFDLPNRFTSTNIVLQMLALQFIFQKIVYSSISCCCT